MSEEHEHEDSCYEPVQLLRLLGHVQSFADCSDQAHYCNNADEAYDAEQDPFSHGIPPFSF